MKKGFTIVELLIVIVVIGILAAISVVAFNGVKDRAENTKTISAVRNYANVIMAYQADNGHYPKFSGWPCLGPHPTGCGKRTSNTTNMCIGGGASSIASFDTLMKSLIGSNLPEPSKQQMTCNGDSYAGAWFHGDVNGTIAEITYYIKGDLPCDAGAGLRRLNRVFNTETTACHMELPDL